MNVNGSNFTVFAMFDGLRERDCVLPFYGEGIIAIDANTAKSGKVNVLVIDVPEN